MFFFCLIEQLAVFLFRQTSLKRIRPGGGGAQGGVHALISTFDNFLDTKVIPNLAIITKMYWRTRF